MTVEENKAIARRFVDALNSATAEGGGDPTPAGLDDLLAPAVAQQVRESVIPNARAAWGWHRIEITDMVAEGDQVWVRLATSGGHTGEYRGLPATGRRWTNRGVSFLRFADGRIVESSGLFDVLNLVTQLGGSLTPSAPTKQ